MIMIYIYREREREQAALVSPVRVVGDGELTMNDSEKQVQLKID
jgi:hypothetical protein